MKMLLPALFAALQALIMMPLLAAEDSCADAFNPGGDNDLAGNIEIEQDDSLWVVMPQGPDGRGLYTYDMTDPDRPNFKWQITPATAGFERLAPTFARPRAARLDLGGTALTPVLVFSGGYQGDPVGGEHPGNAIYVVAADDGRLIWKAIGPGPGAEPANNDRVHLVAGLTDNIPSPLSLVDADNNGIVDRAYVGDSGGKVWRIELTEYGSRQPGTGVTDPVNWYVTQLASLGGDGDADRQFFYAPDFVRTHDSRGKYHGVVIVSGNPAAPRDKLVRNFAYLLKDRRTLGIREPAFTGTDSGDISAAPPVIFQGDLADVTRACAPLDELPGESACAAAELIHGWRLALEAPGEKGLTSPLVSNGRVVFTSYLPAADGAGEPCVAPRGSGRVYVVQLRNGAGSLPPAGEIEGLDAGGRYTGIGPGMPGELVPAGDRVLFPGNTVDPDRSISIPGRSRWRVYWREEQVDSW